MAEKVYMSLSTGSECTLVVALSESLGKVREMTQDYMRETGKWVRIYPSGMWNNPGEAPPPEGTKDMFFRTDGDYGNNDMKKLEAIDIFERELD